MHTETPKVDIRADAWHRRWKRSQTQLRQAREENTRLRAALDEINGDVEAFLADAHQAGHEAAKSHMIRRQAATIREMRARLRTGGIETGESA